MHIRESRQHIDLVNDWLIDPEMFLYYQSLSFFYPLLNMFNTNSHVSWSNFSIDVKLYVIILNECLC